MGALNLAALNLANALGAIGGALTTDAGWGPLSTIWAAGFALTTSGLILYTALLKEAVMRTRVNRQTVDLSSFPDLVVVYLGMRVNRLYGLRTLMGYGPQIGRSAADEPEGLLHHESLMWSLFPMHVGIRQYWQDLPSLLSWARSEPHRLWWRNFLRDSGGTGFWHETYLLRGGMEAVYDDIPKQRGFAAFAPVQPARGTMFGSAARVGRPEDTIAPVVTEEELYTADSGKP